MADTPTTWIVAFGAVLSGSGGKVAFDLIKAWRNGPPKATAEMKSLTIAEHNLDAVVKARDEVIEDNIRLRANESDDITRLRTLIVEQDARHATERAVWLADQTRLREDVARLEAQIRFERDEANKRYDALLRQIKHLGARAEEQGEG